MTNSIISMFIDNELNLDEKIDFVEAVYGNHAFKEEAVDLLKQEKMLIAQMVTRIPDIKFPVMGWQLPHALSRLRPAALFAAGLVLGIAVLLINARFNVSPQVSSFVSHEIPYRFILYRPDASQAEIMGTFTRWQPLAMTKVGGSGYWSLTLNLAEGEHEYSFLVEDGKQISDPTIEEKVEDDFGGENSIISIEEV